MQYSMSKANIPRSGDQRAPATHLGGCSRVVMRQSVGSSRAEHYHRRPPGSCRLNSHSRQTAGLCQLATKQHRSCVQQKLTTKD